MKRTESNFALNLATALAIAALFVLLLITAARAAPGADGTSSIGTGSAGTGFTAARP